MSAPEPHAQGLTGSLQEDGHMMDPDNEMVERVASAMHEAGRAHDLEYGERTLSWSALAAGLTTGMQVYCDIRRMQARAAIAAIREAPAQGDAPTSVPTDGQAEPASSPPSGQTSAPQRGERTAAHPLLDNRPMPDEAYNELYRTFPSR
jgi:hypothetical protein